MLQSDHVRLDWRHFAQTSRWCNAMVVCDGLLTTKLPSLSMPRETPPRSSLTSPSIKKKKWDGTDVEILGPTYEAGKPEAAMQWRQKMRDRREVMAYLQTGLRYWYSDDWYGSERRKTKA